MTLHALPINKSPLNTEEKTPVKSWDTVEQKTEPISRFQSFKPAIFQKKSNLLTHARKNNQPKRPPVKDELFQRLLLSGFEDGGYHGVVDFGVFQFSVCWAFLREIIIERVVRFLHGKYKHMF